MKWAMELWNEVMSFHREVDGSDSDTALLAASKLQELRILLSTVPDDPYRMYYNS